MTMRTLLTTLTALALTCAIASGETFVTTVPGTVTIRGTVTIKDSTGDQADGGGWLGVRIMPVPPALAAHLKTKAAGAMVGNLIKDAPAHKAGLKRYDVIVSVGDKAVHDGQALIKAVRSHKPGQNVLLGVVRKGRKKSVSVVLGKPIATDKATFVHKEDAFGLYQQDVLRVHPQIIVRQHAGDWKKMDGKQLPRAIWDLLKTIPEIRVDKDSPQIRTVLRTIMRKKDSQGLDIEIEQDQTGRVTIRRTTVDDSGKETQKVSTYKDMNELRRKDKEAYELFKNIAINVFPGVAGGRRFHLDIRKDSPFVGRILIDHLKLRKDIREQLLKAIDMMDIPDDVRKQIKEQLKLQVNPDPKDGDQDKPRAKARRARDKKARKNKALKEKKRRNRKPKDE